MIGKQAAEENEQVDDEEERESKKWREVTEYK